MVSNIIAHLSLMLNEKVLTELLCVLILLLQGFIGNRGPSGPPGLKGTQVWRKYISSQQLFKFRFFFLIFHGTLVLAQRKLH